MYSVVWFLEVSIFLINFSVSITLYHFRGALSCLGQFLATESPFKMMKNAFYITLIALFFFKISKFWSWLFGHVEKRLIRKIRLIPKFMRSQPVKQIIAMHILCNISRSKGNQSELREYNMRKNFLAKSYTKWCADLFSRPFSKSWKLSIFLYQYS